MAGTRHHVIPRFLLRGFASHISGDEAYAWVFRARGQPFNTNIKNIAVEGHFYTHDNRPDIDDSITSAEGSMAETVGKLRELRSVGNISHAALAELIAHLEARTRHLRANFEIIADAMFSRTVAFIEDHDAFKRFVFARFESEPEWLVGPLRDELRKRGMPDGSADRLVSMMQPHLPAFVESMMLQLTADFTSAMRHMMEERPEMLRAAARNGQLRALEQAIAPELKVSQYSNLTYDVLHFPEPLPLGDSAVVFEIGGARRYSSFISADNDLLAAYLPLTPTLALCGHTAGFHPNPQDLPSAVALCSLEYFVAAEDSTRFYSLQPLISQLSNIIDEATIEKLLSEAFER